MEIKIGTFFWGTVIFWKSTGIWKGHTYVQRRLLVRGTVAVSAAQPELMAARLHENRRQIRQQLLVRWGKCFLTEFGRCHAFASTAIRAALLTTSAVVVGATLTGTRAWWDIL